MAEAGGIGLWKPPSRSHVYQYARRKLTYARSA